MLKAFKILLFACLFLLPARAAQGLTTGDLLMAMKGASSWPPVILARPELTFSFGTEHFKIHYDITGEYGVYEAEVDEDPPDGIPDYINRMAEYLELSYWTYHEYLGYDLPPPDEGMGGDDRYDIYVTDITGLTVPEFPSDYYPDRDAYASYSFIGHDLRNEHHPDDPLPLLKATCSHEYFHGVQMAYRAITEDSTPWWYELTACWAEERVFDETNEVYYYLEDYYSMINRSLYATDGSFYYGAWIFAEYFSQNFDDDIIRLIFEALINFDNSLEAINTALDEAGINLNDEFLVYSGWNYFTQAHYKPGFFEEAEYFPSSVPISAEHYAYPTNLIAVPEAIENLGTSYIYFVNPAIYKSDLVIEFKSDTQHREGVCLAAIYNDRPVDITTVKCDPEQEITLRVEDFDECEGAVLAVSWLYQGHPQAGSAGYCYSAYLDSSTVGIMDTENLPEGQLICRSYPNPFNSSTAINFSWNFKQTDYTISVYDLLGRRVCQMTGRAATGRNNLVWKPDAGIAGGVYFYRLSVGEQAANGRMIYLK